MNVLNKAVFFVLIFLIFLVAGIIFHNSSSSEEKPEMAKKSSAAPMSIQGLIYSDYQGALLLSRIQADQLQVRPRRFSIFKIKSVNEVVFVNPKFESFQSDPGSESLGFQTDSDSESPDLSTTLSSGVNGLAELKGMGHITAAVLMKPEFSFHRQGSEFVNVTARQGEMNARRKELRLQDPVFTERGSSRVITCEEAIWKAEKKAFLIPGKYRLVAGANEEAGEGVLIDLNLNLQPYEGTQPD